MLRFDAKLSSGWCLSLEADAKAGVQPRSWYLITRDPLIELPRRAEKRCLGSI
jgi:hypothetical protein